MIKFLLRWSALILFVQGVSLGAEPGVNVKLDDPRILYIGRFDTRDTLGPRCEWPASEIRLHVRASKVSMRVRESKDDFYAVVVDHQPPKVVPVKSGDNVVSLLDLPVDEEHTIEWVRRCEATVSTTQLLGIELNPGATLLEPRRPTRKLEVIGDSISCGYGNEQKNSDKHSWAKENAYMSYGAIAARSLDADYHCVAWSGQKMWPDRTMPSIYDYALPNDHTSTWDFGTWKADAVVINLSTNDFGSPVDEDKWTAAYETFVRRVEKNYPDALIYVATSPMLSDTYPPGKQQRTLAGKALSRVVADLQAAGDKKIRLLAFEHQNIKHDGLGMGAHPTIITHQRMAQFLNEALKTDLNWDAAPIE